MCDKTSVITAHSIITKVNKSSYVTYIGMWLLSVMEVANDTPLLAPWQVYYDVMVQIYIFSTTARAGSKTMVFA